jgi:ribosomal protein S18 acetylase RimI-like enzyme
MPDAAGHWREPGPADAEALARMHHRAWRATYGGMLAPEYFGRWDVAAALAEWQELLAAPRDPGETLLAVFDDAGEVLGWARSGPPPTDEGIDPARPLRLHGLYVDAAAHGSGLGAALFDAVLGDRPAEVWLIDGNARAEAFYRRRGLERDGVTGPHLPTGLPGVRMVR